MNITSRNLIEIGFVYLNFGDEVDKIWGLVMDNIAWVDESIIINIKSPLKEGEKDFEFIQTEDDPINTLKKLEDLFQSINNREIIYSNEILTNESKRDFNKWFLGQYFKPLLGVTEEYSILNFHKFPLSMKFGVYQSFFDSKKVNINIDIQYDFPNQEYGSTYIYDVFSKLDFKSKVNSGEGHSRLECMYRSVSDANDYYNAQVNTKSWN